MTAKEQSARFIEMIKEVEADESGRTLESVFPKLVHAKSRLKRQVNYLSFCPTNIKNLGLVTVSGEVPPKD